MHKRCEVTARCMSPTFSRCVFVRMRVRYTLCRLTNMSLPILFAVVALSSRVEAQSRGELRLVRGSATSYSYTSGRLEIFINGRWGTICDDAEFGMDEATVACQQLGWNGASSYGSSTSMGFGQGSGAILLDNVNCYSTNYLHLLSCQYSTAISRFCNHANDVAVTCASTHLSDIQPYMLKVRLVGGQYPSQGRVEVYCNGQWGTICSTQYGFRSIEANTVCRQLGYTDATRYNHLSLPGSSSQPIWLRSFSCGSYSGSCLDTCASCSPRSITICTHNRDVTVQCNYQYYGSPSRKTTCPSSSNTGGGGGSNNDEGAVIGGAVGGVFIILTGIVIGYICFCCCVYQCCYATD